MTADSGFIVFKIHEGKLAHSNVQLEVLMDDYMFPAYVSPKIHGNTINNPDGMLACYWLIDIC